ncbi:MAG: N-acetylmuramoyl-L-alanine amidase [Lysobacterales bacterium]|jgi:N-acetylmuramoyl-L-alanine amidase|nr:MAG: N-acetylmuramoyl-L-alanine amidase [Xanthomonadales bacterium]
MLAELSILVVPLPYEQRLDSRPPESVELVVIHCTETPDLAEARRLGERILYPSGTGASGHFYIDRDGRIEQWVDPLRIAHHVRGHNASSIGIELVNRGRFPDWYRSDRQRMEESYPEAQIEALIRLLADLRARFPGLRFIAGHEDLDREQIPASDDPSLLVPRKLDPGPLFPWARVLEASGLERMRPGGP